MSIYFNLDQGLANFSVKIHIVSIFDTAGIWPQLQLLPSTTKAALDNT